MTGRLVVYILAGFSAVCFTAIFAIGAVKRLRSRGEEAGTPEERADQMAVARAAGVEPAHVDWDLLEEQFYSLTPLVERVKRVKEGRR